MLALSWARAVSASVGVSWGSAMASTGIRCLPGGMLRVGAIVLCAAGILGFGGLGDANKLMRGFGSGRRTLLVVIAVAGWSGSWGFRLRLGVGCESSRGGGFVYVKGLVAGNRVVGVGDVAAVAVAELCTLLRALWWGGLRYVLSGTRGGGWLVARFACHGVVGCSKVGHRGRHIEVVASDDWRQGAEVGGP